VVQVAEEAGHLEIATPMPTGTRFVLGLLALFPLMAPYDLLLRLHWAGSLDIFTLFGVVISAGALALSLLLGFAALAGLSTRLAFDATRSTFTYSAVAPLIRQMRVFPLSAVARVEVRTNGWSEGAPSYSLAVTVADGRTFSTGSSWELEEVERARDLIEALLAQSRPIRQA
jgi:hypothetical protein